ncbi:unnamed protein product [Rhizoctonia solani]|uniref:LYC1 C-terminal domain-containing protein n=1 Tax=Rhizoctonia solani TaxID=456999 RepID=A0A8H3CNY4_9AGAM|nr:unnamed protein product [Rhizoctonia solani]
MSLEHLIIKPATEAQAHEAILRNAAHWGAKAGISTDDYVKLSAVFQQAFAHDGGLKTWVLAPKDDPDTTKFYASGQVYTREVLTLQPGQTSPVSSFGHAISAVLVPPEHRGKGYAQRFMSLMHSVLAPHRYPNPLKAPTTSGHPSTVSVLYSAVGDYYSRCVPATGESGWTLQKSLVTTWPVSSAQIPPSPGTPLQVELLSEADVSTTLDSDDTGVPTDLVELQKKDPTKTYFAFVPPAPASSCSVIISKLAPGGPSNPPWGAKITDGTEFMTWAFLGRPNLKLVATRLRASTNSFAALFGAALQVARDTGCESIEVWNVPEHLEGIAKEMGGETTDRADNLSAFKWYGQQPDLKASNVEVVWALDERYSWC